MSWSEPRVCLAKDVLVNVSMEKQTDIKLSGVTEGSQARH